MPLQNSPHSADADRPPTRAAGPAPDTVLRPVTLSGGSQEPGIYRRTAAALDAANAGTWLIALESGSAEVVQDGRRIRLHVSEAVMLSGRRAHELIVRERSTITTVIVRRDALSTTGAAGLDGPMLALRPSLPLVATRALVGVLLDQPPRPGSAAAQASTAALLALVRGILLDAAPPGGPMRSARVDASDVMRTIAARSAEPALDVSSVAAELNISRRQLQRLLAETGVSFVTALRTRRVAAAEGLIRAGAGRRPRALEDIAVEVGFRDADGMRRAFLATRGITPSEFRRRAS